MALFWQKKTLLFKIETTYGTDPVPTGAANAIYARNVSITPLEASVIERDHVRPYFGAFENLQASAQTKIEFECDIAGSSDAGTAPPWGPLARACGLAETLVSLTSASYQPVSAGFEAGTFYFNIDGVNHAMTGCRGNMSMSFNKEEVPSFKFTFTGKYVAPADVALPALTLTAWQRPLPTNKVNTTLSLHSYAAIMSSMSLDLGNTVVFNAPVNAAEEVRITGRKVTGSVSVEAKLLATKDWFATARAQTTGTILMVNGTTAPNRVEISAPVVHTGSPSYSDADGIAMIGMDLVLRPSAGNDEIVIKSF